jgi:hypothetical protein
MSTITVYVRVSPAAAVTGDGRHGILPVPIELDTLAPESRALLSEIVVDAIDYDHRNDGYQIPWLKEPAANGAYWCRIWSLPAATPEAVGSALDRIALARRALEDQAAAERQAKLQAEEREYVSALEALREGRAHLQEGTNSINSDFVFLAAEAGKNLRIARNSDSEPLLAPLIAEREAAEAVERDAGIRAKAERLALEEAEREELRAWAAEHGSERLRLMLETDVGDWIEIADEEWTDAHAPNYGGVKLTRAVWADSGRDKSREKPTVEELRVLKAFRAMAQTHGSLLVDPRLCWCVVAAEIDEETGEEIAAERKFAVLAVDIRVPSRSTTTVAYSFER